MDQKLNPFRPGPGAFPPRLVGRQADIDAMDLLIDGTSKGRNDGALLFVGTPGMGTTVLLSELRRHAERADWLVVALEARAGDNGALHSRKALGRGIAQASRRMRGFKHATEQVARALRSVTSFTIAVAGVEVSADIQPDPSRANSGNLEIDLEELFGDLAPALRANRSALAIFIDELQDLDQALLTALLAAQHKAMQEDWPFHLVGAGLPSLSDSLPRVRSYGNRFHVRTVGAVGDRDAARAVVGPVADAGLRFEPGSIDPLLEAANGCPYLLQVFGKELWNLASLAPIDRALVEAAVSRGDAVLASSFFAALWSHRTNGEKELMRAIAEIGTSWVRETQVQVRLGRPAHQLAPVRRSLVDEGLLIEPERGSLAFAFPTFGTYIHRVVSRDEM